MTPFQKYPTGPAYIIGRSGAHDVDQVLLFESAASSRVYTKLRWA